MVVYIFVMFCCFFIKEIYNFTHSVNCCYIFFGERCMVEIKKENRKVKSHFITGLLLVLPTVLFFVILWWLLSLILRWVWKIVELFPDAMIDKFWLPEIVVHFLWFLVLCGLIRLLWFIMNQWRIWERVKAVLDPLIEKVPLLNSLTKITNQAANTLQNTNSFKKVVLVRFPTEKTWSVWFLTWEELNNFEDSLWNINLVSVFIPTTPNPANWYLVMLNPIDFVETNIPVSDAISFVISMGTVWAASKIVKNVKK